MKWFKLEAEDEEESDFREKGKGFQGLEREFRMKWGERTCSDAI